MFPWLFFYAPQWQFPFSGSVAQRIEPQTQWFFDAIDPGAGNGRIERQAFEVASYGRQLGLLAEVLVDLAEQLPPRGTEAGESLQRIKDIQSQIEAIKVRDAASLVSEVERALDQLHRHHPEAFQRLRGRIQQRLAATD